MTQPLFLLFGIHNHQPVGNFDDVFAKGFERCYGPVLDIVSRHPQIKVSFHHSGPLLDWAIERQPAYLETLLTLVQRGQIEIMGGGYYEPILTILKPSDALGQIEMMQRFWEERTGRRPQGMWLAERVWEPSLASLMADAGMEFTILDDQHFRHAGMTDEILFNSYRTERAAKAVDIFPSDKTLRYMIPFREPGEVIDHLLHLQERHPGMALTYGDDGEKFGLWPGTYDWVIRRGWLDRFFTALEAHQDRIVTTTFSAFLKAQGPRKTIYLPTASYSEMLEWAMPAEAILRYERAKSTMEEKGIWEIAAPFFRGGFWDNFLTKYSESNLLHKRAIMISNRIDEAEHNGHELPEARKALYRAQCNCAYWHGLFGGAYLNYLRHALYQNMIDAELAIDEAVRGTEPFAQLDVLDMDSCGSPEAVLATREVSGIIKPAAGGSLIGFDMRPKRFNLLNTFARRMEAYHIASHETGDEGKGIPSIHDIGKDISAHAKEIVYDTSPRYAFLDHAFSQEPLWMKLLDERHHEMEGGDLAHCSFDITEECRDASAITLKMLSTRVLAGETLEIRKSYSLSVEGTLTVQWHLTAKEAKARPAWFATEFNFTLLAGHEQSRHYRWPDGEGKTALMDSHRLIKGCGDIDIVDEAFGFQVALRSSAERLLLAPVKTVSQSEKGFDTLYQGSVIWFGWPLHFSPEGTAECEIRIAPIFKDA